MYKGIDDVARREGNLVKLLRGSLSGYVLLAAVTIVPGCGGSKDASPAQQVRPSIGKVSTESMPALGSVPREDVLAPSSPMSGTTRLLAADGRNLPVDPQWLPRADESRALSTQELLRRIDEAFDKKRPVATHLLLFPVVDESDRVRPDGIGLSAMAGSKITSVAPSEFATHPFLTQRLLSDVGSDHVGDLCDEKVRQLCVRAMEADLYAVPRLFEIDTGFRLKVDVYLVSDRSAASYAHDLQFTDLAMVSGHIARDVLTSRSVALTADDDAIIARKDVQSSLEATTLSEMLTRDTVSPLETPDFQERLATFTLRNPSCIPSWNLYLRSTDNPSLALTYLSSLDPPLVHATLTTSMAQRLVGLRRSEEAMLLLLNQASEAVGQSYYHRALADCSVSLGNEEITRHLLERWHSTEPGYGGAVGRGEFLTDWAWRSVVSRADLGDSKVDLLKRARHELEYASTLNDSDWQAHVQLIRVATGLGLPPDYIETHFVAATKMVPSCTDAYRFKLQYLQPAWHGSNRDFAGFARECVNSNQWSKGIPQLVLPALLECGHDSVRHVRNFDLYADPDLWSTMSSYHQAAVTAPLNEVQKRYLAKQFVKWAACGGWSDDAAYEAFLRFAEDEESIDSGSDDVFTKLDYLYVGEIIHATAGWGNLQRTRAARLALAAGDLERASRITQGIIEDPVERAGIYETDIGLLNRTIDVLRILKGEGKLAVTPPLARVVFGVPHTYGWNRMIGEAADKQIWSTEGDILRWQATRHWGLTTEISTMFGLRHARVSGEIEWTPGIRSVEIRAHTCSLRDQVDLLYAIPEGVVSLRRNGFTLQQAAIPAGPQRFVLEYGRTLDHLEPFDGVSWDAAVVNDQPSGFGIRISAKPADPDDSYEQLGQIVLRNLFIELHDED